MPWPHCIQLRVGTPATFQLRVQHTPLRLRQQTTMIPMQMVLRHYHHLPVSQKSGLLEDARLVIDTAAQYLSPPTCPLQVPLQTPHILFYNAPSPFLLHVRVFPLYSLLAQLGTVAVSFLFCILFLAWHSAWLSVSSCRIKSALVSRTVLCIIIITCLRARLGLPLIPCHVLSDVLSLSVHACLRPVFCYCCS